MLTYSRHMTHATPPWRSGRRPRPFGGVHTEGCKRVVTPRLRNWYRYTQQGRGVWVHTELVVGGSPTYLVHTTCCIWVGVWHVPGYSENPRCRWGYGTRPLMLAATPGRSSVGGGTQPVRVSYTGRWGSTASRGCEAPAVHLKGGEGGY
jgi:hypothetical protein